MDRDPLETMDDTRPTPMAPIAAYDVPQQKPFTIATISAGFEKGDFLVREEQGARIYFDFFEEAFNYIANKGYARMESGREKEWIELMNVIHDSVKGGMKYNTGTLLMVLTRPIEMRAVSASKNNPKASSKDGGTPLKSSEPGGRSRPKYNPET
mmetsp:Transcript_37580/g.42942  ORF Transcript_37580/g.42942 Transcript_37580/m.42942 type:complete len:154 (+) Transcript_37580:192-653(+)|eukprot:CAMPEP_0194134406 /NCGR_PEP_ID=MMETSP0152-20130528/4489_1 /TAXON_ID=1049557 /ORGANISM="Thalassiothrix antarctica, Strain L6-D1" /LENGTH=153 /DNA_ID=CAMNT_0038830115 /DNA_START=62 /DNA_END=523 /DNA_ORIENTATION=+